MKNLMKIGVMALAMLFIGNVSLKAQSKTEEIKVNKTEVSKDEVKQVDPTHPAAAEHKCKHEGKDGKKCVAGEGKACCKKDGAAGHSDMKKCEKKDCKKACCAKKEDSHDGHNHN